MLEMAKNLAAATLHMEVSGMYVEIKYTRLFKLSPLHRDRQAFRIEMNETGQRGNFESDSF